MRATLLPMQLEIILDFILIPGVEGRNHSRQHRYLLWHLRFTCFVSLLLSKQLRSLDGGLREPILFLILRGIGLVAEERLGGVRRPEDHLIFKAGRKHLSLDVIASWR